MALTAAQREARRKREARAIAEFKAEEKAAAPKQKKVDAATLKRQKAADAKRKAAAAKAKRDAATAKTRKKPTTTQAKAKSKKSLLSQMRNRNRTIDKEVKRQGG